MNECVNVFLADSHCSGLAEKWKKLSSHFHMFFGMLCFNSKLGMPVGIS